MDANPRPLEPREELLDLFEVAIAIGFCSVCFSIGYAQPELAENACQRSAG
jgi:hypothetical protein